MTDEKTIETGEETTDTVDLWVAGTEEPQFQPTDEGQQQMLVEETEEQE